MTDQIEVPVRAEIPLSKYLARIPKALFLKARSHCDRKGISLNTLITIALRDYLDAGDIDVPSQPKLSQVFKDEIAGLEARLLQALKPPVCSIECKVGPDANTQAYMKAAAHLLGVPYEKYVDDLKRPLMDELIPVISTGTTLSMGTRSVQPQQHLTVPGALEWDKPAPQQRLWPENPPVNGLAPEPLRGQVWVVTGDFDNMTTSRAREILQQAGAIVATTVNKKTSAVLAGISGESEKLDTAESRMLPIWTELQFLHMAKFIGADVRIPE